MTPERIAELRAIIAAASLMDEEVNMGIGKAVTQKEFYQSAKLAFPQALDTIEAQAALIAKYHAEQSYSYIGKDGKSIKARDLEDQRDELAARSESQQRRIEELEAAISWAYETLMEINVSNYTHDDVCNLNNRSVEVILGLAALQPKEAK